MEIKLNYKVSKDKLWRVTKKDKANKVVRAESMIVTGGGTLIATAGSEDAGKQMTLDAWCAGCWDTVEQIDELGEPLSKV